MTDHLTHQRIAAARHILASPSIATRTAPYVSEDHIDWYGVLDDTATMSSGERFLVDVARRIWAGEALPEHNELIRRLDVGNAQRVDDALACVGEPQHQLAAAA
jgi:hypothetical protein